MSVPPSDKQKAAPVTSSTTEAVKADAKLHLARWLATGQPYHLRLARAKFYALRKGAK